MIKTLITLSLLLKEQLFNDKKFIINTIEECFEKNNIFSIKLDKYLCDILNNGVYINKNNFNKCIENKLNNININYELDTINTELIDLTSCKDKHIYCNKWSEIGECYNNSKYMFNYCPKSCNLC